MEGGGEDGSCRKDGEKQNSFLSFPAAEKPVQMLKMCCKLSVYL